MFLILLLYLIQVVFDRLHETAYQGCGLARTILGPKENIKSLTRDDLSSYIKTHYTAPRMVVAGAGAVDHAQLSQLAEGAFGNLPQSPAAGLVVPDDPVTFVGSDVRVRMDGKYFKRRSEHRASIERASRMEHCSSHFYNFSFFPTCFIVIATISSILKHPNKSFLTQ